MSWTCPNCENPTNSLYYQVSTTGTEYGTAIINQEEEIEPETTEHECNDSESDWNGLPEYQCRNCNEEIILTELIWKEEEEKEEEKETPTEEEKHKINRPKIQITTTEQLATENTNLICKKCYHVIINHSSNQWNEEIEEFNNCPNCGTPNSQKEYRKLLAKGHYN